MEGGVVRRTRPNPDKLPDDHFIDWLGEAKQIYRYELPPFVEKNQGSNRAGLRKNVTLRVTDDQDHGIPVEAEVTCWSWSPYYTFCTLDIGGRRLIVKGDSSSRYCSYRSWLGSEKGFTHQPVAFGPWQKKPGDSREPDIDLKTQHAIHIQTFSNTPCPGSSTTLDSRAQHISTKNHPQPDERPSRRLPTHLLTPSSPHSVDVGPESTARQVQQNCINKGTTAQAASPPLYSPRPNQANPRNVQVSPGTPKYDNQHLSRAPTEGPISSGPRPDASSPKGREEHSPDGPCVSMQVSPSQDSSNACPGNQEHNGPTSKPNDNSAFAAPRQQHAPAERFDERAIASASSAYDPVTHRMRFQPQGPAEPTPPPSRPTKRRRQLSTHHPTSPQLSTAMRSSSARSSPHPTPSTSSQAPSRFPTPTSLMNPHPTDSSSPLLAPHKQSRTTLFIAIPLSSDTVPLKLRSCMSLAAFFTAVLAISEPPACEVVSGIRASFDWKLERDVDRAILLKRDFPDTFEVLLEIVDGAPCWGMEGGRCGVAVEVVLV
ncbi:hypothetical protein IMSHALPRED_005063 [Imshaugia aleurites]|uniref:Uncharacterized protein n=1 Tax=Imshaugia aleurites TaxID=172621 RepID=A0A8H3F967_9LECA|nr:hypothetical protein IMSHALPRED_005063 [Imshaugia aleurites]